MMKRVVVVVAVILSLMFTVPVFANKVVEKGNFLIYIDNELKHFQSVPIVSNDRTLLPFREILVALGISSDKISWNDKDRSVTAVDSKNRKIYMRIGNSTMSVDNISRTMDVAPIIYKDRTYIPLRFLAEVMDKDVEWIASEEKIIIRQSEKEEIDDLFKAEGKISPNKKYSFIMLWKGQWNNFYVIRTLDKSRPDFKIDGMIEGSKWNDQNQIVSDNITIDIEKYYQLYLKNGYVTTNPENL